MEISGRPSGPTAISFWSVLALLPYLKIKGWIKGKKPFTPSRKSCGLNPMIDYIHVNYNSPQTEFFSFMKIIQTSYGGLLRGDCVDNYNFRKIFSGSSGFWKKLDQARATELRSVCRYLGSPSPSLPAQSRRRSRSSSAALHRVLTSVWWREKERKI